VKRTTNKKGKFLVLFNTPYHVSSEGQIWTGRLAIVDSKGALVENAAGKIMLGLYEGKYTEKKALAATAEYVNEEYGLEPDRVMIRSCTRSKLEQLISKAPSGGLRAFVVGECVGKEKTFYMRELYLASLGQYPVEEEYALTPIRTAGCEGEQVKRAVQSYLKRNYKYEVKVENIRLVTAIELKKIKQEIAPF